jgi:TonB family protein
MLVFSSATVNNSKAVTVINNKAKAIATLPAASQQLLQAINTELKSTDVEEQYVVADILPTEEEVYPELSRDMIDLVAVSKSVDNISPNNNTPKVVFTPVEKQPEFPGGMQKFYELIKNNIRYPDEMRQSSIEGKVFLQWVVEKDGSVTDLKAIRAPGYGSEEEATRVLSQLPKWNPGTQNGHPVSVRYMMPVTFKLQDPELADTTNARNKHKSSTQFIAGSKTVTSVDVLKTKVLSPIVKQPESSLTTMVATLARRVMGGLSGMKQDED